MAQDTGDALVLRMEATLAKFEKQMARAKKVGRDAALSTERQFSKSNKKMSRSAENSAQVIAREMDRLRAKYDPVFAASKRYEASLDELNRAHKLGALNAKQYDAALGRLNSEYTRSTAASHKMAVTGKRMATATRGMGGGIQNVAFQVGDFATQVGAGTSASVALGQQLPQLLGGFGALGAVLGAVVAIGVPLAAAFMRSEEEAKSLSDRLDSLKAAVDEYRDAVDRSFIPTEELAKKYGTATAAAREFISALREIASVDALQELDKNLNSFMGEFGDSTKATAADFDGIIDRVERLKYAMDDPARAYSEGLAETPEQLRDMLEELERLDKLLPIVEQMALKYDVSAQAAERLAVQMKSVDDAGTTGDKLEEMRAFISLLEGTLGPYEDMSEAQQTLYDWAVKSGERLAQIVGVSEQAADGLSGMASEAARVADELERAVGNAINLAAQGISDVRRAKIEYEFRDDPIGRAGALAAERFDTQTAVDGPVPDGAARAMRENREAAVGAAVAVEEYRQKLIAWRKEQAELNSSGSGGGREGRDKPDLFDRSDDQMLALEREMEMLGKTGREVAELRAKYRLLDEARERGLDLDARSAATGQTLREEIDRQAASIGNLTEQYSQARDRAKFFEDQQSTLANGMIDAVLEAENLSGALESVAKSFARAALQAVLLGEGPLAEMFGGGDGLLGAFGSGVSKAAAGTAFSHGGATLVGERGPEIVNLPRGSKVYSNEASRGMLGGDTMVQINNYASDTETRQRRRRGPNGEEVIIDVVNKGAAAGKLTGMEGRYGLKNQKRRR